jgi:isopenicillin-N N-acyltransferase-like protein
MQSRRDFLAMAAAAAAPADGSRGAHLVYDFRGTPFEVGLQHGKALREEIRAEAQPAFGRLGDGGQMAVSKYEGLYREHMPAVLEEIHGIAEGAGLKYPHAFFAATRDMMRIGACTAVACSGKQTAGGHALIGQTKDTNAPLNRFRIMRIRYASGRSMVVLNYPGWIANLCITSDGLAFTGNSLYASSPDGAIAPGSFLKRLIMEKRSTQEVLGAIQGMSFDNGCVLVGDRSGHMVCLEMVAGRTAVRDVSGQAFGHANDVLSFELKKYETASHSASSPSRQANIDRILRDGAGQVSADFLKAAFRNHTDYPLSICRHPSSRDSATTNAAFIADLSSLEMHIAIGNPCVAPFVKYDLPT